MSLALWDQESFEQEWGCETLTRFRLCKNALLYSSECKVCQRSIWSKYHNRTPVSNNIWKEMTAQLRLLEVKYWLRRNRTVGQLQIARAIADQWHTGQSTKLNTPMSPRRAIIAWGGYLSNGDRYSYRRHSSLRSHSSSPSVIRLRVKWSKSSSTAQWNGPKSQPLYYDDGQQFEGLLRQCESISHFFQLSIIQGGREREWESEGNRKGYLVTEGISLLLSLERREAVAI